MRKLLSIALAAVLLLSLAAVASAAGDYTIRIYSNSNSSERTTWLINAAKEAGFNISIDDNSVISGDTAAIQAANENKDGDLIFGLNETLWSQLVNGQYENLKIADWTPSWAEEVGDYAYPGKAYGLVIQNVLMLVSSGQSRRNHQLQHQQRHAVSLRGSFLSSRRNLPGRLEDPVEILCGRQLHRRQLRP